MEACCLLLLLLLLADGVILNHDLSLVPWTLHFLLTPA